MFDLMLAFKKIVITKLRHFLKYLKMKIYKTLQLWKLW